MNVVVSGYGQMGQRIAKTIEQSSSDNVVGIVDLLSVDNNLKFSDLRHVPDVIIDFSHPTALPSLLDYAVLNSVALVIGTTGYSKDEIQQIKDASQSIPIVYTSNTSIGVQGLLKTIQTLQTVLPNAQIDITETHHIHKKDAPSGTAKMIVEALGDPSLPVVSIREGDVVGIHEVRFTFGNEIITISHEATSKQVFVDGAITCATFIVSQPPGLYAMSDVVKE